MPDVPRPRPHRPHEALGGQGALLPGPAPPGEDEEDPEEREGVEQERRGRAGRRDHEPARGGADGTGHVHRDAAEGHRRRDLLPGDELRGRGLPGGGVQGRPEAEEEGQRQEQPRRHQAGVRDGGQGRRHQQHPPLGHEEQSAPVHDVGQRPGGHREQEDADDRCGFAKLVDVETDRSHHVREGEDDDVGVGRGQQYGQGSENEPGVNPLHGSSDVHRSCPARS